MFTILGVSTLNYGCRLETTLSNMIQRQRRGDSGLIGLDIRVLTITIILSLVFLGRALIDFLMAWNLIAGESTLTLYTLVILFTELSPALLITVILTHKSEEEQQQEGAEAS